MGLFLKFKAKRELKRRQKQKRIKELEYELSVKDEKIRILERHIRQLECVKRLVDEMRRV